MYGDVYKGSILENCFNYSRLCLHIFTWNTWLLKKKLLYFILSLNILKLLNYRKITVYR